VVQLTAILHERTIRFAYVVTAMKIDAHHHFWKYVPAEYDWISDQMSVLQADFLPADLKKEIDHVGIDGAISVQARQSVHETEWLLDLAEEHDFIKGVVGWVPLASPDVRKTLERLLERPKLKGVRHVVQDEPDDHFILRNDFNLGVSALADFGLVYDILIFERHLPQAIEFVDRHPNQRFVLDHLAKPRAKEKAIEPWCSNLNRLAQRENVCCKLSGLVTEADWASWTYEQLRVYLDIALEAFGPRRVMFGSDWPVCLLAATYSKWYEVVSRFCGQLSADEQSRLHGSTAIEVYRL
jgi:L-fuconolactonase